MNKSPSRAEPSRTSRASRTHVTRDASRIAVLDRAVELLAGLAQLQRPATLNEAAQLAGLSKATAFRILSTLAEHGLVEQDGQDASYHLGISTLKIATAVLDGIEVDAAAKPVMRAISELLNETIVLSVRDGDFRVNIDAVECTNAIGSSRRVGEPRPLHAGAASRVLLAAMSDAEIEGYVKRHRIGVKGSGGPAYLHQLWKDIRKARRTGLASMPAEQSPESHAIATPIMGVEGRAIAVLYVAVPRGRLTSRLEARCGQALLRAAAEISRDLAPKPRL